MKALVAAGVAVAKDPTECGEQTVEIVRQFSCGAGISPKSQVGTVVASSRLAR